MDNEEYCKEKIKKNLKSIKKRQRQLKLNRIKEKILGKTKTK